MFNYAKILINLLLVLQIGLSSQSFTQDPSCKDSLSASSVSSMYVCVGSFDENVNDELTLLYISQKVKASL